MFLTDFRTLGRSGLVVSPLALGTMTFGTGESGADEDTSRAIFDAYREAGGNFVDTADIYSGGESERMVGKFIADTGARDEIVLATKFGFNSSASPGGASQGGGGNPNAGGAGAKNIHRALEGSLGRLGTDYIDLYWMHIWDGVTPVAEIVQTLAISCGRARSRLFRHAGMGRRQGGRHCCRARRSWTHRDAARIFAGRPRCRGRACTGGARRGNGRDAVEPARGWLPHRQV